MLKRLQLQSVGPSKEMSLDFAPRLNIFTGDNGLGKTFLLDIAWWVLTRTWAGEPAWPRTGEQNSARIFFEVEGETASYEHTAIFEGKTQSWKLEDVVAPPMTGLILYMRLDGGFSLWDSVRNYRKDWRSREYSDLERPEAYHFDRSSLWEGLEIHDNTVCRGLIEDWITWQDRRNGSFQLLTKILERLSPDEVETIVPGEPARIKLDDVRDVPSIVMPYGEIPVTLASAGMKRILSLAYIMVWAYTEHRRASALIGNPPSDRFVVLIDEVEAHLHPQWQRVVLPSIFDAIQHLNPGQEAQAPAIQLIATTHAPLTLASIEAYFDADRDCIHVLKAEGERVFVEPLDWRKRGDATAWLRSEAFEHCPAYSPDADRAMREAEKVLAGEYVDTAQALEIHRKLQAALGDTDPFWVRWCYVAEKKGWLS